MRRNPDITTVVARIADGEVVQRWPNASRDLLQAIALRLLRDCQVTDDGCWLWTGEVTIDGYGRITVLTERHGVHRLAYQVLVGPIPPGHELDHECHNRDRTCSSANTADASTLST